jgi:hypothetical protein
MIATYPLGFSVIESPARTMVACGGGGSAVVATNGTAAVRAAREMVIPVFVAPEPTRT